MKGLIPLIFFAYVGSVCASSESGTIASVLVNAGGYPNIVFLKINGDNAGKPSCQSGSWEYGISIANDTGRAMYSLALSSYMAGKTVYVYGDNTCSLLNGVETAGFIYTQ